MCRLFWTGSSLTSATSVALTKPCPYFDNGSFLAPSVSLAKAAAFSYASRSSASALQISFIAQAYFPARTLHLNACVDDLLPFPVVVFPAQGVVNDSCCRTLHISCELSHPCFFQSCPVLLLPWPLSLFLTHKCLSAPLLLRLPQQLALHLPWSLPLPLRQNVLKFLGSGQCRQSIPRVSQNACAHFLLSFAILCSTNGSFFA
mmetsp:Transcript_31677/g.69260  ORF Transcript_31677/g.69260 Transcript_31677/m.69260 type:complete len:203 (-) Transcript_31677:18-626(-)